MSNNLVSQSILAHLQTLNILTSTIESMPRFRSRSPLRLQIAWGGMELKKNYGQIDRVVGNNGKMYFFATPEYLDGF
jgi:hypothetical protein